MVLSNTKITEIKNASLDTFDDVSHMAVSTEPDQDGGDSLSGEVDRVEIDEAIKTAPDKYNWETVVGLTEAVGYDLEKVGFFTDSSGDNLKLSEALSEKITKTELIELNVGMELTLDVVDNTWSGES